MFLHKNPKEKLNALKQCDACKFEKDETQVKQHRVKEHSFMFCVNCDRNIKHKEILLTENFDMKDFLSVIFRDK